MGQVRVEACAGERTGERMNAVFAERSTTAPDTRLAADIKSLRDIRDVMDRAAQLIRDCAFHESVEVDGEVYTGEDIADDLRQAESALYLHERAMKSKGAL